MVTSKRQPLSQAYARLGAELRRVRETAGVTTRQVQKPDGSYYGSGSISNAEAGYSQPSIDMVKAYARLGGHYPDLIALLDSAKKGAGRRSSAQPDEFDEQLRNPKTDPHLLRRGYALDLEENTAYIGPDRVPKRNVYRALIRPLSPMAQFFVFRYGHEPDPRRGVASVRPGAGCELAWLDENDDGTILAVLRFNTEERDELGRCSLSWVIEIDSDKPNEPSYEIHTRSLMAHIVTRIQFEPPAVPQKIWWFRGVDPFESRIDRPERVISLNPLHLYLHEFHDVEGESCGLGWNWA
jgi:hypothetical protein